MSFELTKFPKKRYTMMEYHLFDMMPRDGTKVTSADLAEGREALGKWKVKFPLKNITMHMNNLIGKVDLNKEVFRVGKEDKYPGHPQVEYWIEPRSKKANGR